jgi:hypothetical protein
MRQRVAPQLQEHKQTEWTMKELLKITAATAALVLGVSGANAALLLHEDPLTGQKKVINTETESEAQVLMSTDGQPPADCPEGAFFLFEDPQNGKTFATECVSGRRFLAGEPGEGTQRPTDIPEGAVFLTEDPLTGQPEQYTTPMEAPRHQQ